MKHWRSIAILGAILLALGGIATWDEWQSKKDNEAEKTKNRLTLLSPDDIVEIVYQSKATPKLNSAPPDTADEGSDAFRENVQVKALRKDGVWHLIAPINHLADATTIESLLKTLTDYTYTQEITAGEAKWAEYGLNDPHRTLTLHPAPGKGQALTLFIGSKAPVGYNVYFRTSTSDKVFMGSQHLLMSTAKSLFDFQDKKVLMVDEPTLTALKYETTTQPEIEIVKSGPGYVLKQPENAEADSAEVRDFIGELNSLKAISITETPSAQLLAAFAKPDISISWQNSAGVPKKMLITSANGKLFASSDPTIRVLGLGDESRQKLKKDLLSFKNRRILSTDLLDVKSVDVDGLTYQNIEGSWYTPANAEKLTALGAKTDQAKERPTEEAHIRAFMVDLEFAKTDRFLPSKSPEAQKSLEGAPLHRITLSYQDTGKKNLTIELFAADEGDKFFVRRSDKENIYRVSRSAFHSMEPGHTPPTEKVPGAVPSDDLPVDSSEDADLNLSTPPGAG